MGSCNSSLLKSAEMRKYFVHKPQKNISRQQKNILIFSQLNLVFRYSKVMSKLQKDLLIVGAGVAVTCGGYYMYSQNQDKAIPTTQHLYLNQHLMLPKMVFLQSWTRKMTHPSTSMLRRRMMSLPQWTRNRRR